jgi:hypothetical protein
MPAQVRLKRRAARSSRNWRLGAVDAAVTLRNLQEAEDNRVKLGAAGAILELGLKLRENVEMEARLRALEERAAREAASGRR